MPNPWIVAYPPPAFTESLEGLPGGGKST